MLVTKCDICKKQIKGKEKAASASFGSFYMSSYVFCEKCGKPVRDFLTNNKLKNKYDIKEK